MFLERPTFLLLPVTALKQDISINVGFQLDLFIVATPLQNFSIFLFFCNNVACISSDWLANYKPVAINSLC